MKRVKTLNSAQQFSTCYFLRNGKSPSHTQKKHENDVNRLAGFHPIAHRGGDDWHSQTNCNLLFITQ